MWVPKEGKEELPFVIFGLWKVSKVFWLLNCYKVGTVRLLRPRRGRGFLEGCNFVRGLILGGQFWKGTKREGVEILRHRAGLLCKICQTTGSLSATKCYQFKAWPRNLSAKSTNRNVAYMKVHMPMHTAEIWKKNIDFFISYKHFCH